MNLILFNRAVANAGPMSDTQRKAMWAKRRSPAARIPPRTQAVEIPGRGAVRVPISAPASRIRLPGAPSGSGARYMDELPGILPGEWRGLPGGPSADGKPPTTKPPERVVPVKPIDQIRQPPNTRPTGTRGWGESRPGEMYPQVEGPGNPSWERRHPERAPGGLPADRPRGYTPPSIPQQPGVAYPGGSPNFDERTGRYITSPIQRPGRPSLVIGYDPNGQPILDPRTPHIPEDPRFRPVGPGDTPIPYGDDGIALGNPGRDLDPKVRKVVIGLQNMLDRLRGFST